MAFGFFFFQVIIFGIVKHTHLLPSNFPSFLFNFVMPAVVMGSACCVAAKDPTLPNRTGVESLHRNIVYSPSWSFRWDSRGRVAGEIENHSYHTSHGVSRNISMELKGSISSERGNLSDGASTLEHSITPISLKSPLHEALVANPMTPSSGNC